MSDLVRYLFARADVPLPPLQPGALYEYVFAANGVFVRGKRTGLEATIPVARFSPAQTLRGLATIEPSVRLLYPRVPAHLLAAMLQIARTAYDPSAFADLRDLLGAHRLNLPAPARWLEVLFDLDYTAAGWELVLPEQIQAREQVQPADVFDAVHARALIHAHSHHVFAPTFSAQDNLDHTGFRLYAVLGYLATRPALRVRVGIYGYWLDVPAWTIFEESADVRDAQDTQDAHADA
jgi:hypothetical protein